MFPPHDLNFRPCPNFLKRSVVLMLILRTGISRMAQYRTFTTKHIETTRSETAKKRDGLLIQPVANLLQRMLLNERR